MGGFSILHWLIVLMFLAVPLAVIVVIVWAVSKASRRPAQRTSPPPITASSPSPAESHLAELASLRSKGLITDSEYEQRRQAIIQSV
jgi:uncharacterized membrane protein